MTPAVAAEVEPSDVELDDKPAECRPRRRRTLAAADELLFVGAELPDASAEPALSDESAVETGVEPAGVAADVERSPSRYFEPRPT